MDSNSLYRPDVSYPETRNVLRSGGGNDNFYGIQVEWNELIFRLDFYDRVETMNKQFESRMNLELAILMQIPARLILWMIVECFVYFLFPTTLRIECSSSNWTDLEKPNAFLRPPRKPPDKFEC